MPSNCKTCMCNGTRETRIKSYPGKQLGVSSTLCARHDYDFLLVSDTVVGVVARSAILKQNTSERVSRKLSAGARSRRGGRLHPRTPHAQLRDVCRLWLPCTRAKPLDRNGVAKVGWKTQCFLDLSWMVGGVQRPEGMSHASLVPGGCGQSKRLLRDQRVVELKCRTTFFLVPRPAAVAVVYRSVGSGGLASLGATIRGAVGCRLFLAGNPGFRIPVV
ncbi:hypothetical protein BDP55DRAFT_215751 [Colletotrichum godetiae]|uniref:Uncharacterized protein n=1 Tax=Colletotrichum godetiae TaxID=1209918 RepID=A0AAJ0F441_9PEZI|nr:uncharacterized protein BDP55DRAFT_215751 [Colletotrichum godetiae]KAK1700081.1 hypothetical protein BDP55DRAFT_215751 [Colletotrichum godetiae]